MALLKKVFVDDVEHDVVRDHVMIGPMVGTPIGLAWKGEKHRTIHSTRYTSPGSVTWCSYID